MATTINNLPCSNVLFPFSSFSSPSQTHMSASGTSFPDSDWPRQDPTRPDLPSSASHHLPPDPLLDAGSFIDSSAPSCRTLPSPLNDHPRDLDSNHRKKVETSSTRRSPLRAEPLNGKKLPPDAPSSGNGDSTPARKVSGSKPTDASSKSASSEPPNWLPQGWVVEDRVRSSGATAGTHDKVN